MNNLKLPNSVKPDQILIVGNNQTITSSSLSVKELTDNLILTNNLQKQVNLLAQNFEDVNNKLDIILS